MPCCYEKFPIGLCCRMPVSGLGAEKTWKILRCPCLVNGYEKVKKATERLMGGSRDRTYLINEGRRSGGEWEK